MSIARIPASIAAPWTFDGRVVAAADGAPVPGLVPSRMTPEVLAAVVALPDTLAALRNLVATDADPSMSYNEWLAALDAARAAIAKAEAVGR